MWQNIVDFLSHSPADRQELEENVVPSTPRWGYLETPQYSCHGPSRVHTVCVLILNKGMQTSSWISSCDLLC